MLRLAQTLDDPNGIVSKLIFEDDNAIAEAVAYRYQNRGVVCFSVQSGCRIGCRFCGTGRKFVRNLTTDEMLLQVEEGLRVIGKRDKIEIMSMSMGEPMDNWIPTKCAIQLLMAQDPKTRFYLSTVCLDDTRTLKDIIELGKEHPYFGLQFSLHHWHHYRRQMLLGNFEGLMPLPLLVSWAWQWKDQTGKRAYFNYIAKGDEDDRVAAKIAKLVAGHHLTCSVMCDTTSLKLGQVNPASHLMDRVAKISMMGDLDVEVSMFNPAGQDTIGGGCGQLLYVQKKLRNTEAV